MLYCLLSILEQIGVDRTSSYACNVGLDPDGRQVCEQVFAVWRLCRVRSQRVEPPKRGGGGVR